MQKSFFAHGVWLKALIRPTGARALVLACWCCCVIFLSGTFSAGARPVAVLSGDYPDPTVVRVGADFYMTHSPFHYQPGFLIWHSTDLINWQPVARALPQWKGSAMAPDLSYVDGTFYLYFPANGTNYVSYAPAITGPWSEPVDLHIGGIDPGLAVDEQGNRFLYTNAGHITPLSPDGLSRNGQTRKVYEGWDYPSRWKTEGKYLESPKIIRRGDYYYMTSAEGGTAGPATSHMAVVARSKSVEGPWENSPQNPLVHTYSVNDPYWSKGHGTLVDDEDGNWYIVYHAYGNNRHALGRQTLVERVDWTPDGWPVLHPSTTETLPQPADPQQGLPLSDDFNSDSLRLQWTFWKEYAPQALRFDGHTMHVKAKGSSPRDGRLLLTTPVDDAFAVDADMELDKGAHQAQAGLLLFYNEKGYCGLTSDGKDFIIYLNDSTTRRVPNTIGRRWRVRMATQGHKALLQVCAPPPAVEQWQTLAEGIDLSGLHHNRLGGFYALRPALVSMGKKGEAMFHYFNYRPSRPSEEEKTAYLLVTHSDHDHSLHMAVSRDGYSFTALRDGAPVISGDTIAGQRGIRDPHIYRDPRDGAFLMAMTDLHIFAQREGKRDTEWERPSNRYAWGNNHALVLMKSYDLIHWQRTNLDFFNFSKEFAEVGCAWAPETIFDPETGRLMLYFTMRFGNGQNRLYYAYVDDDFTRLTSIPQLLFEYPADGTSAIDGDISVGPDGRYHLLYVAHDGQSGIKQAVADHPTGPWHYLPAWIDNEPKSCEAPTVWKRAAAGPNDKDKWVLMIDCFGLDKHNFGFMETEDFNTFTPIGHFNEGVMKSTNFSEPKHGAVVAITAAEADRLENFYNNSNNTNNTNGNNKQ